MIKRSWQFQFEDGAHEIVLEHGYLSGKRKFFIDGEEFKLLPAEARHYPDVGSTHTFEIAGHECMVVIQTNGVTFTYDLVIDGIAQSTQQLYQPGSASKVEIETSVRRKTLIGIFLITGAFSFLLTWWMAFRSGYYLPIFAIMAPELTVLAFYLVLYPGDVTGKIPLRFWAALALGLALGVLHNWLLSSGFFIFF